MIARFVSLVAAALFAIVPLVSPAGAVTALAVINPSAWVQILPVQARNNSAMSPVEPVPAGLSEVAFRLDVPVAGQSNPFVLTTQEVDGIIQLSYDGGITFPDVERVPFFGKPTWDGTTGGWGRAGAAPIMAIGFAPSRYPTHLMVGYVVVSGPVSFGASYQAD